MNTEIITEHGHMVNLNKIRNNGNIVDCGASLGRNIRNLIENGLTNVNYFAIEPNLSNLKKFEVDIPYDNIFWAAIVNNKYTDFSIKFTEFTKLPSWGNVKGLYKGTKHGGTDEIYYEVPVITLEKIITYFNLDIIDYLKIDCEGAEGDLIFDITKDLSTRIMQLSVEVHTNVDINKLEEHLTTLGYKIKRFDTVNIYATL